MDIKINLFKLLFIEIIIKLKRLFIFLLIIILLGTLSVFWPRLTGRSISNSPVDYPREPALVTRIVYGDTIHVKIENSSEEIIRLLGLNNPKGMDI